MLIQSLINYYDTLLAEGKVAPVGWTAINSQLINVDIDDAGTIIDISPPYRAEPGQNIFVPFQPGHTNSGADPFFLCDNTEFVLGWTRLDKGGPGIDRKKFQYSMAFHTALLSGSKHKGLQALAKYFTKTPGKQAAIQRKNFITNNPGIFPWVMFTYKGKHLVRLSEAKRIWNKAYAKIPDVERYPKLHTIDTCKIDVVAPIHPKVRGMGCAGTGAVLIGNNLSSSCSYGLQNNAPISALGAFKYTTALSYILNFNSGQARSIGSLVLAYWAQGTTLEGFPQSLGFISADADIPETLKENIALLRTGRLPSTYAELRGAPFTCCFFKPNSSRLAVKDLIEGQLDDVVNSIGQWYSATDVTPYQMLAEFSITKKIEDIPAPYVLIWFKSILFNKPLPIYFLNAAVTHFKRAMSTGASTRKLMEFIKYYTRRDTMEESLAFKLGRVFRLFTYIQYCANKQNSIQRRFKAACESPAAVLPGIYLRVQQAYLPKLPAAQAGWAHKELTVVSELFSQLPVKTSLKEQAQFIAGYHSADKKEPEDTTISKEEHNAD